MKDNEGDQEKGQQNESVTKRKRGGTKRIEK